MIWISSDLHFHHDRSFLYEPRGFESFIEHDAAVIHNWNSVVKPEDEVFLLGDIMLQDNEYGIECFKQLNGKIHIIIGNHDSDTRIELYKECPNVVEVQFATRLKYGKYHFYLSHYPALTSNFDYDKPLKNQTISLCGHSHCKNKFKDMDKGIIYHCELDCNDNMPVEIPKIIDELEWFSTLSMEDKMDIINMEEYNG